MNIPFLPLAFFNRLSKIVEKPPGKAEKEPPMPFHGEVFREEAGSPVILSRSEESVFSSPADSSLRLRMTGEELDGEKTYL